MSSTRSPHSINAFAIDAFRLSTELRAVGEQDAPGVRAAAIREGRRSYETLIQARQSLSLSRDDARAAENMLQAIDARLEYLCSITFRRNQWRWRREGPNIEEVTKTELHVPSNWLARPSLPRWWRSYAIEGAPVGSTRRG